MSRLVHSGEERRVQFLLAVILLLSLASRLMGNGFGLPYLGHPDEGYLLMPALGILTSGDWNPGRFEYGSLYIYSLVPVMAGTFLSLARARVLNSTEDIVVADNFRDLSAYPYPEFIIAGRSWTAILAVATIALVAIIAWRKWGPRAALLSAAILAALPLHSLYAHFITVDAPATFMTTLTLFVLTSPRLNRHRAGPFLVGLTAGLAISTKYSVFPIALMPLAVYLFERCTPPRERWPRVLSAAVGLPAGFLLGSPYIIVSVPEFLNTLAAQSRIYNPGQPLVGGGSWRNFFGDLGQLHTGLLFLAAVMGWGWLWRRGERRTWLELFIFPIGLLITVLSQEVYYDRNWLPVAPYLALAAGYGLVQLWPKLAALSVTWHPERVVSILILLFILSGFVFAFRESNIMRQGDVRQRALAELEAVIPPGSRVAIDLAAFVPPNGLWDIERIGYLGSQTGSWYRDQGIEYVIVTEPLVDNPNRPLPVAARETDIWQQFELIAHFAGPMIHKPDQQVWLLQVR